MKHVQLFEQFHDYVGIWAARLGMTREEYVAHFASMTMGIDEAAATDSRGKMFDVKGISLTYTEQRGRFYGAYLYDVNKTSNVQWRAKLSLADVNSMLNSMGIKEDVPERYDIRELDKICKIISKKGIVCSHNDAMDIS